MTIPGSVERFLESVREVADAFSGLRTNDSVTPLYHHFWSPNEIARGRAIKGEWDVPEDWIPFYGDWHTLLCISITRGEIFLIDDARTTIFAWNGSDDFLSCLTTAPKMEESSSTRDGIVEDKSWLDL
jgi:hypothetical protein